MPRLFVGVEVPERLRSKVVALQTTIKGLRWVGAEQMHLTLRFIGHVDQTIFERIRDSLSTVKFRKFSLELLGAGAFPNPRRARVLWLGITDPGPLIDLKKGVDQAVDLPDRDSDRPYKPHFTLARIADAPREEIAEVLRRFEQLPAETFDVERFVLFSSKLSPKGATYTAEAFYGARPE